MWHKSPHDARNPPPGMREFARRKARGARSRWFLAEQVGKYYLLGQRLPAHGVSTHKRREENQVQHDKQKRPHEKISRAQCPRDFTSGFTKPCNQGMRRLWQTASGCTTSSERLRLSRTAKRSGAVVTGRLVKREQVAHPCKSCQTQQYGYVAHAFVSSASVLLGRRKD